MKTRRQSKTDEGHAASLARSVHRPHQALKQEEGVSELWGRSVSVLRQRWYHPIKTKQEGGHNYFRTTNKQNDKVGMYCCNQGQRAVFSTTKLLLIDHPAKEFNKLRGLKWNQIQSKPIKIKQKFKWSNELMNSTNVMPSQVIKQQSGLSAFITALTMLPDFQTTEKKNGRPIMLVS